jgi:hypothetical protein
MDYKDLKKKWIWKHIDFDWVYQNQCVDLVRQATLDLYWSAIMPFWWSAYIGWKTWRPFNNNWQRVKNTIDWVPKVWSVVFFDKTSNNPYWHVAIVWEWTNKFKLVVLEQNNGNWNGDWKWKNVIRENTTDYINPKCLWWFIYKK